MTRGRRHAFLFFTNGCWQGVFYDRGIDPSRFFSGLALFVAVAVVDALGMKLPVPVPDFGVRHPCDTPPKKEKKKVNIQGGSCQMTSKTSIQAPSQAHGTFTGVPENWDPNNAPSEGAGVPPNPGTAPTGYHPVTLPEAGTFKICGEHDHHVNCREAPDLGTERVCLGAHRLAWQRCCQNQFYDRG